MTNIVLKETISLTDKEIRVLRQLNIRDRNHAQISSSGVKWGVSGKMNAKNNLTFQYPVLLYR